MKKKINNLTFWLIVFIELSLSFQLVSEPSLGVELNYYFPSNFVSPTDKLNNMVYDYYSLNLLGRFETESGISPVINIGLAQVNSHMKIEDNLKHIFYFASAGASWSQDLNLFWALSLDLTLGMGVAHFYQFDNGFHFETNFIAEAKGHFLCHLSPSFQLRITPKLLLRKTFFNLTNFDNLLWGIGASLSYVPGELNRKILPIKLDGIQMDPLFVSMKNHYTLENTTVGSVSFENRGNEIVSDIKVYLSQRTLMDSPTLCYSYDALDPGNKIKIPLKVNLNNNAFFYEGETVLNGEIQLTYVYKQNLEEQYKNITFKLYDENTIQWNDTRKIGAYISGMDKSTLALAAQLNNESAISDESLLSAFWESVEVFHALSILGIKYKKDPQPIVIKQDDLLIPLDHINFPKDTLKRQAGDCDDLTVLFCSLMEARGIETAVISLPGHILPLVNLQLTSKEDYLFNSISRKTILNYKGVLWLPLEITDINESNFLEAWQAASEELKNYKGEIITIANSHLFYPAITPPDREDKPILIPKNELHSLSVETKVIIKSFSSSLLKVLMNDAYMKRTVEGFDKWGKTALLLEIPDAAFKAYTELIMIDPENIRGVLCLGLACCYMNNNQQALYYLKQGLGELEIQKVQDPDLHRLLYIKISSIYREMGDNSQADSYLDRAQNIMEDNESLLNSNYLKRNEYSGLNLNLNSELLKKLLL